MNYDEMTAGREMDALIAEKMTGKKYLRAEHKFYDGRYVYIDHKETWSDYQKEQFESGSYGAWEYCGPLYSTDIAAAWEVAAKMSMPFEIAKSYEEIYNVGPMGWQVCWCPNKREECEGCGEDSRCTCGNDTWSESAPLAICRAALKALEQSSC